MADSTYIEDIAQQVHDENATSDQFAVSQTPFHTHNGSDSQQVDFANLKNRSEVLHVVLPGTSAATAGNYGVFFIAPYKCVFVGATEVHQTAGSDGSPVTVNIEKLTGTTASGSGTSLLLSTFNMKAAANTVQTAMLAQVPKVIFNLNKGDRLGLVASGAFTSVAQAVFIIQVSY